MRTHGPPIRVWGPSRWRWPRRVLARPARVYSAFATFFGAAVGVVLLTNQLWLPGAVLLGLVSAAVLLVAGALLTRPHVTLADRHAWGDIDKSCRAIAAAWPDIGGVSGARDVTPAIDSARWDLARLIAERARLSDASNDAKFAEYGLEPDDSLRGDLAGRRDQVTRRLASTDAQIADRIGRLRSLAEHCAHFARDRDAMIRAPRKARRAREALERADAAIRDVSEWDVRTDPAIGLSERTEAVLTAYRELAAEPWAARRI
jgi:hypothetical protein